MNRSQVNKPVFKNLTSNCYTSKSSNKSLNKYLPNKNQKYKEYFIKNYPKKSPNNSNKIPFKQGMYSYKNPIRLSPNPSKNNTSSYNKKNNSLFVEILKSNNSKNNNYLNQSTINNNINNTNISYPKDTQTFYNNNNNNNSGIYSSSLNLNKYKIITITNQPIEQKSFVMNNISNNITNNNSQIVNNLNINLNMNNMNDSIKMTKYLKGEKNNKEKNESNCLYMNNGIASHKSNKFFNLKKNNSGSSNNESKNLKIKYKNFFVNKKKYEIENRRLFMEYLKILKNKNNESVYEIISKNNFNQIVMNQEFIYEDYDKNNELFGDAKKELYLKYLNYSLSSESDSNNNEENVVSNKIYDLQNSNILNNVNYKIDILIFLCAPRVLYLVNEDGNKQKCIFILSPDEKCYLEGIESYIFKYIDMDNNEEENSFNINCIKSCYINKDNSNSFIIEVYRDKECENFYEIIIEAPSQELCDNYNDGINYLIQNKK